MSVPYEKWLALGKELGFTEEKLENFVSKKEQEFLEREERARRREDERAEREVQREMERMQMEAKLRSEQQEREIALRKAELDILRLKSESGASLDTTMRQEMPYSNRPKLPRFDENKDDMDAFIERFERFATSLEWPEDTWATYFSPLLTGKGLQAYACMPADQVNDYRALKKAVLHRYQLTSDGFRNKFREAKPDKGETVFQFVARLKRYLDRWTELAEANDTVDAMKDLLVREQLINTCSTELALFLKERVPKTVDEATQLAEQYLEAHGGTLDTERTCRSVPTSNRSSQNTYREIPAEYFKPQEKKSKDKTCFYCKKEGHIARDCRAKERQGTVAAVREVSNDNWRVQSKNEDGADAGASVKTAAFCQVINDDVSRNTENGLLKLADGSLIPIASGMRVIRGGKDTERLISSVGYIGNTKVKVLRDTGCTNAVVRSSLVRKDQLTRRQTYCALIDGTVKRFPVAMIQVDTPYYTGCIEAMCMENPIQDLVIGNLPGATVARNANWPGGATCLRWRRNRTRKRNRTL